MTARVSIFVKSRASLTCFRACFLPGRAKDLSAPRVFKPIRVLQQKAATDFNSTNTAVSLHPPASDYEMFLLYSHFAYKAQDSSLKLHVLSILLPAGPSGRAV